MSFELSTETSKKILENILPLVLNNSLEWISVDILPNNIIIPTNLETIVCPSGFVTILPNKVQFAIFNGGFYYGPSHWFNNDLNTNSLFNDIKNSILEFWISNSLNDLKSRINSKSLMDLIK